MPDYQSALRRTTGGQKGLAASVSVDPGGTATIADLVPFHPDEYPAIRGAAASSMDSLSHEPALPATSPVFGGLTEKDQQQAELLATRLQKRARHLRRWPTKRGITCYRIYERDIPELPFVIDRYEEHYHMTEYERPHDRDPGRHAAWLELMKKTVAQSLAVPIGNVHLKSRLRQKGARQYQRTSSTAKKIVVQEDNLRFLVNLSDYIDTGLFLDTSMGSRRGPGDAISQLICLHRFFFGLCGGRRSSFDHDR